MGDGEGQGSLAWYSPWGRKESDTTEGLNNMTPNSEGARELGSKLRRWDDCGVVGGAFFLTCDLFILFFDCGGSSVLDMGFL